MPTITVQSLSADCFKVVVKDEAGTSSHDVTATVEDLQQYGGGVSAERLLTASFEFLLERESKESILSSFNLQIIEQYFPEFPIEIQKYLH